MHPNPLDIEQPDDLRDYLRATRRIEPNERVEITLLTGGISNRTVLVELPDRPGNQAWVLKQALAKLRVAVDWFSDPARIEREALALRWLPRFAPPGTITPIIFDDPPEHLLAMEAVARPHENWKAMLLAGRIEPDHFRQFAGILAAVHRQSAESVDSPARVFADRSYFESLREEPYYTYTAGQVPEARAFLECLVADTRRRRLCLVHGDYSPKNVLVHAGRLVLLDHEVIHWGDPAFDIGFAMTHFLSKAHHLPALRPQFERCAALFAETYAAALSPVYWNEAMAVRHTLGCLLARVAGRSPLEYLSPTQKERQRAAVVALMVRPPPSLLDLKRLFLWAISDADDNPPHRR